MTNTVTRKRISIALRIVGAVLMLAAEACVMLMIFVGGEMIPCVILAVVLMAAGVLVWRRGWQVGQ